MSARAPKITDVVLYKLNEQDVAQIISARASRHHAHHGNNVSRGQAYPMVIVRVWGSGESLAAVNGQVLLDGPDTHWVTSRHYGDGEGEFTYPMPY